MSDIAGTCVAPGAAHDSLEPFSCGAPDSCTLLLCSSRTMATWRTGGQLPTWTPTLWLAFSSRPPSPSESAPEAELERIKSQDY